MPDNCKVFCSYDTDLEAMPDALDRALECEAHLGKVYKCAAGRDSHVLLSVQLIHSLDCFSIHSFVWVYLI
jgi:hypothetical protein